MKPGVIAGVIVVVLIAAGVFAFIASEEDTNTKDSSTNTQTIAQPADTEQSDNSEAEDTELTKAITTDEVAKHNTSTDCWTIVNGNIYDITSYVPRHPGGNEILRACGADGSSLFNSRTTTDGETVGSGTSHSSNAVNQLSGFKIGTLAN